MSLLVCLARQAGDTVRREELLEQVWNTVVGDEVLSRGVSLIRQALGDDPRQPRFVETIPKIGYRLLERPRPLPEATPAPRAAASTATIQTEQDPDAAEDPAAAAEHPAPEPLEPAAVSPLAPAPAPAPEAAPPALHRHLGWLVTLVVVTGLVLWWLPRPIDEAPPERHQAIAVLPLEDLRVDAGDPRPLGLGLSDELRSQLAQVAGLRVLARRSSMAVAQETSDARALGRDLGIDVLLEGSVLQSDDRVTVNLTLSSARDGYLLWSRRFETDETGLFDLRTQLAADVLEAVNAALGVSLTAGATAAGLDEPDATAYALHLRGLSLLARRGGDNLLAAEALFEQALSTDPGFDAARVALARTRVLQPYWIPTDAGGEDRIFDEVERDLAHLRPADTAVAGEREGILAFIRFRRWQWDPAEASFRRALELAPQQADLRAWHAQYLAATGRLDDALAEALEAFALNPDSPIVASRVAIGHLWLGQPEQAAPYYDTSDAVELAMRDPSYLVWLLETGEDAEVVRLLQAMHTRAGLADDWAEDCVDLIRGRGDAATLARYEAALDAGQVLPRLHMAVWILAGRYERAADTIEAFRDQRQYIDVEFLFAAQAAGMREHPAFRRALALVDHPSAP